MLTFGRALILCEYLSAVGTGGILVSMMLILVYQIVQVIATLYV